MAACLYLYTDEFWKFAGSKPNTKYFCKPSTPADVNQQILLLTEPVTGFDLSLIHISSYKPK